MKTVTLNHIVRNTLMDMQFPLHYYVRFLHYGIQCLEELNYDFPLGDTGSVSANYTGATASNVKSIELDVTSYMRAILPGDCVDIVDVSAKYGEHVLPLRLDPSLNLVQKYDAQGNKVAYADQDNITYDLDLVYTTTSHFGHVNEYGEHVGRAYGIVGQQSQSYNVDREAGELVFNNAMEVNKVTLTYITDGVSTTEANVVHPYAQDVIKKYIMYQKHYHTNTSFNKVGLAKQDFVNAKRKLRARLNSLSYADIIASLRTGIHGSIKN